MGKRSWAITVAAAVLAGAVGCGGDGSPAGLGSTGDSTPDSPAPGPGRPCELLTGEDAAPLLGIDTVTPAEDTAEDCVYKNGVDLVQLTIAPGEFNQAVADQIFGARGERVEGIGDVAYTYELPPMGQTHVWVAGLYLTVTVLRTAADADDIADSRTLAQTIVGRL